MVLIATFVYYVVLHVLGNNNNHRRCSEQKDKRNILEIMFLQ